MLLEHLVQLNVSCHLGSVTYLVYRSATWLCAYIEQNTDLSSAITQYNSYVRLNQRSKRIEEPSVGVELLLVRPTVSYISCRSLLQAEYDLYGTASMRRFPSLTDNNVCRVLVDVRMHILVLVLVTLSIRIRDCILGHSLSIHAHNLENLQHSWMTWFTAICHYADYDFLPRPRAPGF